MSERHRRYQISELLRAWRRRVSPYEFGLVPTTRRRHEGLYRQDVALLIGTTHAWYVNFESGAQIRVPPVLIQRIAKVLRLNAEEYEELVWLAFPEFHYAVDALSDREPGIDVVRAIANQLASASSKEEAAELVLAAISDVAPSEGKAHFSVVTDGTLTFTRAKGSNEEALLTLPSLPYPDVDHDVHVVEDASLLDTDGRTLYEMMGARSSLCVCFERDAAGSAWVGLTRQAPHRFTKRDSAFLDTVGSLLTLAMRKKSTH